MCPHMAASFPKVTGGSTYSVLQNYEWIGTSVLQKEYLLRRIRALKRKHHMKFRHIGHTTSQYGQLVFSTTISAWNRLAFAEAVFRSSFL